MPGFIPDASWPSILELAIELWGPVNEALSSPNEKRFGEKGSKAILLKEQVFHDYEAETSGGYVAFHKMVRGPLPPRAKPNGHDDGRVKPWQNIGVVYPYHAADGTLVLQVIRTITGVPRFNQRRPAPETQSGWRWSVREIPVDDRPLYRLPELIASGDATVWICEGEKDVDTLAARGLIATTNVGGSGKWRDAYAPHLMGRDVVVLPDNDDTGRAHSRAVAASIHGLAASVRVLQLPDLPPKGDVSDWLANGGDTAGLERLARDTPLWLPPAPGEPSPGGPGGEDEPPLGVDDGPPGDEPPPPDGPGGGGRPLGPGALPVITVRAGELPRMVREAEAALLAAGVPVYQRSVLVRPAEQEYPAADGSVTHSAALVPITPAAMLALLARVADWQKWDARVRGGGGFVACDPSTKVVDILLANRGQWAFPVVRGVLTSPTIRPDGSLLTTPGYDPTSRYYLMFPTGLTLPEIPEAPSQMDALESLDRLDALLDGYDFIDDGGVSRSVALAILMTQVLRCGMAVSPLLAVSATAPGSGKSHLIDLASTIAIGRPCPIMGAGKNDEETEKGINTNLLSGVSGFSIDNVHRLVDLAVLNIATERPMIGIRLFGTLDRVEVENAVVVYMTGNNLPIIDEQVRRSLLCSLDAGVEQPEQREFTTDPITTVLADRGRYIADVLTIARAYLADGVRPMGLRPFGSYPGWARLVREPLVWLGRPDPVLSQNASRASDPEMGRLRAVITAWFEAFHFGAHTLADAARFALTPPVFDPSAVHAVYLAEKAKQENLRDVLREHWGRGTNEIDTGRWGYWMSRFSGRLSGGMMFRKDGITGGSVRWAAMKP